MKAKTIITLSVLSLCVIFGGALIQKAFFDKAVADVQQEIHSIEELHAIRDDLDGDYILMVGLDFEHPDSWDDFENNYDDVMNLIPEGTFREGEYVGRAGCITGPDCETVYETVYETNIPIDDTDPVTVKVNHVVRDEYEEGVTGGWKITDASEGEISFFDLNGEPITPEDLYDVSNWAGVHVSYTTAEDWYEGWDPIGKFMSGFTGTFNGNNKTITNLHIDRIHEDFIGLFGESQGSISNVNLVDVDVSGDNWVGGLVGRNQGTTENAYITGRVSGNNRVGGLTGSNYYGIILDSRSTADVSGNRYVGGLAGNIWNGELISDSYSTGDVSGEKDVGGLVGYNGGGDIENSYSTGDVYGERRYGGLVGVNAGKIGNSFYNYDETLINGESHITRGALYQNEFNDWLENEKDLDIEDYFPEKEEDFYLVNESNFGSILAFAEDPSLKFKVEEDIDLSAKEGFYIPYFTGEFDGGGHKISNLNIDIPFADSIGLFGHLGGGEIKNVGLVDVYVSGKNEVGGLVGVNAGKIENSYSTGYVTGYNSVGGLAGGFIGRIGGDIENSYSKGDVSGEKGVGGLVGMNTGKIENSYSTGDVSGEENVGGLVGDNRNRHGDIENSFWDTETSNQAESDGGEGKTTAEMQNIDTFTDTETEGLEEEWSMVKVQNHDGQEETATWYIGTLPEYEAEQDYPRLWFEMEPAPEPEEPEPTTRGGGAILLLRELEVHEDPEKPEEEPLPHTIPTGDEMEENIPQPEEPEYPELFRKGEEVFDILRKEEITEEDKETANKRVREAAEKTMPENYEIVGDILNELPEEEKEAISRKAEEEGKIAYFITNDSDYSGDGTSDAVAAMMGRPITEENLSEKLWNATLFVSPKKPYAVVGFGKHPFEAIVEPKPSFRIVGNPEQNVDVALFPMEDMNNYTFLAVNKTLDAQGKNLLNIEKNLPLGEYYVGVRGSHSGEHEKLNTPVTRAEFVGMVVGCPNNKDQIEENELPFSDVPKDHKKYEAIRYLYEKGILEGYEDGTFRPDAEINRVEALKVILLVSFEEADILSAIEEEGVEADFNDTNPEAWYFPYLSFGVMNEFVSGYKFGNFRPAYPVKLGETAKMIVEIFEDIDLAEDKKYVSTHWAKEYLEVVRAKCDFVPHIAETDYRERFGSISKIRVVEEDKATTLEDLTSEEKRGVLKGTATPGVVVFATHRSVITGSVVISDAQGDFEMPIDDTRELVAFVYNPRTGTVSNFVRMMFES